uniref:Uncharacterized protein n=1 Tax=Arundo donax TaxID=35708 RepID=A0A0A8Y239_ARUDO
MLLKVKFNHYIQSALPYEYLDGYYRMLRREENANSIQIYVVKLSRTYC